MSLLLALISSVGLASFGSCDEVPGDELALIRWFELYGAKLSRSKTEAGQPIVSLEVPLGPAHELPNLAPLNQLTTLSLKRPWWSFEPHQFTSTEIGYLQHLDRLSILEISDATITDDLVADLSDNKALTELSCNTTSQLTGRGIGRLKQLQSLTLYNCRSVDDDGLSEILTLPKLGRLSIDINERITRKSLEKLNAAPSLRSLKIIWPSIDKSVQKPMGLPSDRYTWTRSNLNLKSLSVVDYQLGQQQLLDIATMVNLEELEIHTDGWMSPHWTTLAGLTNLKRFSLHLQNDRPSIEPLADLSAMTKLEELEIETDRHFTETQWKMLAKLSRLKRVTLLGGITDRARMSWLKGENSHEEDRGLVEVSLRGNWNHSENGDAILTELSEHRTLKRLEFTDIPIHRSLGLNAIAHNCKLEVLKISDISMRNNEAIDAIAKMTTLKTLVVDIGWDGIQNRDKDSQAKARERAEGVRNQLAVALPHTDIVIKYEIRFCSFFDDRQVP